MVQKEGLCMLKKVLITLLSIILVVLFTSPSSSAKYITSKSNSKLVDLRDIDRTIVIDLRYATKNNFTTINDEWWHYTDKNWKKYPILNVPLHSFK